VNHHAEAGRAKPCQTLFSQRLLRLRLSDKLKFVVVPGEGLVQLVCDKLKFIDIRVLDSGTKQRLLLKKE